MTARIRIFCSGIGKIASNSELGGLTPKPTCNLGVTTAFRSPSDMVRKIPSPEKQKARGNQTLACFS
jgi:hypothetical protein